MFDYIERRGGSIIFKWGYATLAVLLISIVATHATLAVRYQFGGERLTLSSVDEDTVVMVDRSGHEARFTGSTGVFLNGGTNTVTYMDRVIQYTVDWDATGDYIYTFSDGTTVMAPFLKIDFGDRAYHDLRDRLSPLQREEYDLLSKMEDYLDNGNPIGKNVALGLLALLLMLLGMVLLCFPEAYWRYSVRFTVQGGEPTDWAIFSNRVGGMILVVFAFAIPFLSW